MKWLVIIAILIVIAVAMVWLRTVRQGSGANGSGDPHRLDESVSPSADADNPLPPGSGAVAGGATGGPSVDLPSSATWASEEAGSGDPGPDDELPPSETHPRA